MHLLSTVYGLLLAHVIDFHQFQTVFLYILKDCAILHDNDLLIKVRITKEARNIP